MDLHSQITYYITTKMCDMFTNVSTQKETYKNYDDFKSAFLEYFNKDNFRENVMPVYFSDIDDPYDDLIDLRTKELTDVYTRLIEFYPILNCVEDDLYFDDYLEEILYDIIIPYFK